MNPEMVLTFVIFVGTIVVFIVDKLRVDIVALLALLALVLFGIIDIVAINIGEYYGAEYRGGKEILGVQSCGQSFAAHDKTIYANENSIKWLLAGGKLQLWSWRKVKKKRSGKQMIWEPRIKEYTLEDFK